MNQTYISITITYYDSRFMRPEVHYYRSTGLGPAISTWDKLTVDEANKLMWELVKLGGTNRFFSNEYNNKINYREVTFYGIL